MIEIANLKLNNEGYVNLLLVHCECDRVVTIRFTWFVTRYLDLPQSTRKNVNRILKNLKRVEKVKHIVDNTDHIINILGYYVGIPEASLHCDKRDLGIQISSVQRI